MCPLESICFTTYLTIVWPFIIIIINNKKREKYSGVEFIYFYHKFNVC